MQSRTNVWRRSKACAYGCLGYGNCVRGRPVEAITMGENGLPVIDTDLCIACGLCARNARAD